MSDHPATSRPMFFPSAPEPQVDEDIEWNDPLITPPNFSAPNHPLVPQIVNALRRVYDPEIPVSLYELGLIYILSIDVDNNLDIKMTLTTPGCPVAGEMPGMVQNAIFNYVPDAGDCDVEIIWDPQWTQAMMSESARAELNIY